MSDRINFKCGRFSIECFTGGYPLRAEIADDRGTKMRIEGCELKDLGYLLDRMRSAMRRHYMRPGYNMQNDALELD